MSDCLMSTPKMYRTNRFYASITDNDGNSLSEYNLITSFSVNGKNISVTIFDAIQENNIEKMLDSWINGIWIFKKRITITLKHLDELGREIYTVTYENCRLKRYSGNGFNYALTNSENAFDNEHLWYAEFVYGKKKIKVTDKNSKVESVIHSEEKPNTLIDNRKDSYESIIANSGKVSKKFPKMWKKDDKGNLKNIEKNINSMITKIEDKFE